MEAHGPVQVDEVKPRPYECTGRKLALAQTLRALSPAASALDDDGAARITSDKASAAMNCAACDCRRFGC